MNFYLFFTGFALPVVFISLKSVFYYFIKFKTVLFQFIEMNHTNDDMRLFYPFQRHHAVIQRI